MPSALHHQFTSTAVAFWTDYPLVSIDRTAVGAPGLIAINPNGLSQYPSNSVSGTTIQRCLYKKMTRSQHFPEGLDNIGINGREFKQDSIRYNTMFISSKVKIAFPKTRFKWYFIDVMHASYRPRNCGSSRGEIPLGSCLGQLLRDDSFVNLWYE